MLGKEQGTTLVEVVLAVAIFSLLLTTLLTFYYSNLQSWKRSLIAVDIQQNARVAMGKIVGKLRYAHTLDEQALPLYCPGDEKQQGATSLTFTGLNKTSATGKMRTAYVLRFNKTKRSIELKSGIGPYNEIAYHVAGLDFFRYLPPGASQADGSPDLPPLVLVVLKLQENDQGPARGNSCVLQSVVRLQNLVLPME
ncbi:MAG: hypothetical protein GX334_02470 [Firmicutes bacterium]|nr:hypothetical protein [Bacillota bacterium]